MYKYNAELVRVVDGDTLVLDIDLGFRITTRQTLRVRFLDTPEMFSGSKFERQEGRRAKMFLAGVLMNKEITVEVHKNAPQSFSRWVGVIYIKSKISKENVSLAKLMVVSGFEKNSDYNGIPAKHFNAKRRAEDLANAGVEEYYIS